MSKAKLTNIKGLSEELGPSVRQLRTLKKKGFLPFYQTGYRSCLFDPEECRAALELLKVKAIGGAR